MTPEILEAALRIGGNTGPERFRTPPNVRHRRQWPWRERDQGTADWRTGGRRVDASETDAVPTGAREGTASRGGA